MDSWLQIANKVVIVTGGSSGIGKAIVEQLLTLNCKLILADLHPCPTLADSDNLTFIKTDVSSKQEIDALIAQTIQKYGRIDALVNNAGINMPRLLVDPKQPGGQYELGEMDFDRMVNVNQKSVFLLSQAVAHHMIKATSGVIINMSSESGLEGSEGQSCYAATKAALYSLTRSWAKELGKFGIRVIGVAPGILEKTGLRTLEYEQALAYTRGISVEKLREGYTKNAIPLGRSGKLSEVADFVAYLISPKASYVSGVTYNINGGKTRG